MKRLIKGTMFLLLAVLMLEACGQTKLVANQQSSTTREAYEMALAEKADRTSTDSLLYSYRNLQEEVMELKATFAEMIPEVTAQVTIPTESLADLPDGAKFGTSNGRASVEAVRQGDNIVVTGRCDSIARQCMLYERQATRHRQTIDSLNAVANELHSKVNQMELAAASKHAYYERLFAESKKPPRFKAGLIIGLIAGVALTILARYLWKRFGLGTIFNKLFTRQKHE